MRTFARAIVTVDEKLKKIMVVCNPNSIPSRDPFELWKEKQGLKRARTRLGFMDYLLKYQTVICSIESIWSKIPTW